MAESMIGQTSLAIMDHVVAESSIVILESDCWASGVDSMDVAQHVKHDPAVVIHIDDGTNQGVLRVKVAMGGSSSQSRHAHVDDSAASRVFLPEEPNQRMKVVDKVVTTVKSLSLGPPSLERTSQVAQPSLYDDVRGSIRAQMIVNIIPNVDKLISVLFIPNIVIEEIEMIGSRTESATKTKIL